MVFYLLPLCDRSAVTVNDIDELDATEPRIA